MNNYDVTVIGGGPAGLAAAIAASEKGAKVLLIERENRLGGVLKQCIHDGFGLLRFGEKLSGCEYATKFIHSIHNTDVEIRLLTFASKIERDGEDFVLSLTQSTGFEKVISKSLILATGCRERTARQVSIHGTRPAGVLTAGTAQYYINVMGQLPGKKCVILGSGDIGLIMARRLTLEGADVLGVYEAKSEPSGLMRNIYQCLVDFDIPLHLSHTVTEVHGRERLEGVTVAEVDERMQPIPGTEEYISCDTLILSVGLIPENELAELLGVTISRETKGPVCDENYQTNVPGIFSCGNALHVNDLVDYVSESGEKAGEAAAEYVANRAPSSNYVSVIKSDDFAYIIPNKINSDCKAPVQFFFRTKKTRGRTKVRLYLGDALIIEKSYQGLRPPEMEKIEIDLSEYEKLENIRFEMMEIEEIKEKRRQTMSNKIEKDLICIVCPNGCRLHGVLSEEGELTVTGNRCVRGKAFAGTELTNPTRSLTTTVKTDFEEMPYLPVRTDGEIPKYAIPDAIKELSQLTLTRKYSCGDTVLENLAETGIRVIAAMDLE